ncbi:hypothetical protein BDV06DRAFT_28516 [Aspergillus oleicola]
MSRPRTSGSFFSSQVRPVSLSANPGLSRRSFVLSSEPRDSVRSFFASTARPVNGQRRSCLAKRSNSTIIRPPASTPKPTKSALQRNAAKPTVSIATPTGILRTVEPAASANGGRKKEKKSVVFAPESDTVSTVTRWIKADRRRHVRFVKAVDVKIIPRWIHAPEKRVTFGSTSVLAATPSDDDKPSYIRHAPYTRRHHSVHVPYATRRSLFPAAAAAAIADDDDTQTQSTAQVDMVTGSSQSPYTLVLKRREASQTVLTSTVSGGPNFFVVLGLAALSSLVSSFFW